MMKSAHLPVLVAVGIWACGTSEPAGPSGPPPDITLDWELVVSGLNDPILVTTPAGDARLFIVQQDGIVRIFESGALVPDPFVDISAMVGAGGERGLLGMAFHHAYATTGFVFVSYTDQQGTSQVDRYTVSGQPNLVDPNSRLPIFSLAQPYTNHNGGMIAFGPDGHLYLGLGDGGSGGDPLNAGQDTSTLLGSMLRLDVDTCAAGQCAGNAAYTVPADNPFVGTSGRDEIWAYGLRNPWRFSFDYAGGMLYIGDVGQNSAEEINAVDASQAGVNYGWRIMEGAGCFGSSSCDMTGLTMPVTTYPNPGDGCAVVGGYVYRGSSIPELDGTYFYSDFCSGWLRSFRYEGGEIGQETEWDIGPPGSITSFGQDAGGELYVTSGSAVYRLVEVN